MKTVLVWKNELLPASETFVRSQADSLTNWRAVTAGLERVSSANSRDADHIALPDASRAAVRAARFTGLDPRVKQMIKAINPDVIHAHFIPSAWTVLHAAADLGIPLVVTAHGIDVTALPVAPGLRGLAYRGRMRRVFAQSARILTVSNAIHQRTLQLGAPSDRTFLHYTGIPTRGYDLEAPKEWDVIFVGRMVAKKAPMDLIKALAASDHERPLRAVFIGDGPLLDEARSLDHELGTKITFLGQQDPVTTRHHLVRSRIAAVVSKTASNGDMEGLPTVALEAAAAGVPLVATRHSGTPEAVVDGRSGLLIDEGDIAALTASLRNLIRDDHTREYMGRFARSYVQEFFDIDRQSSKLEQMYTEALDSRS